MHNCRKIEPFFHYHFHTCETFLINISQYGLYNFAYSDNPDTALISVIVENAIEVRTILNDRLFRFCVLKKWVHYRIGQYVRPAVYTITLQGLIRLWRNFVQRTVSSISRSREEDEKDWSTPSWFIAKNVIIPVGLFHGVSHKKT